MRASGLMADAFRHPALRKNAAQAVPQDSKFYQAMLFVVASSLGRGRTPAQWHYSHGFRLAKNNGKALCHGRRLLHSLSPVSKAFHALILNDVTNLPGPLPCQYGCFKRRCREEAILIQNIVGFVATQNGLMTTLTCYDMTNAFPSIGWSSVKAALSRTQPFEYRQLLLQHVVEAKCLLDTPDGTLAFRLGSGVFPGSSVGPRFFHMGFAADVLDPWITLCSLADSRLSIRSVVSPDRMHDLSTTTFVDDIAKRQVAGFYTELGRLARTADKSLYEKCGSAGLASNDSKKLSVFSSYTGVGAVKDSRKVSNDMRKHNTTALGICSKQSRYLGPHLDSSFTFVSERPQRVRASQIAFRTLKKLFISSAPKRARLLVHTSTCMTVLYSAVVGFVLTKTDYKCLDACICKQLRPMMRGESPFPFCEPGELMVNHQYSNNVVLSWARYLPSFFALSIARLRFAASLLRFPGEHELALAALFGKLDIDKQRQGTLGIVKSSRILSSWSTSRMLCGLLSLWSSVRTFSLRTCLSVKHFVQLIFASSRVGFLTL